MGVLLNILVQIDKFANFQVKTGSIRNAKTNGEAIQLYDPAFAVLCLIYQCFNITGNLKLVLGDVQLTICDTNDKCCRTNKLQQRNGSKVIIFLIFLLSVKASFSQPEHNFSVKRAS